MAQQLTCLWQECRMSYGQEKMFDHLHTHVVKSRQIPLTKNFPGP
jgi:hypothetical protein